MRKLVVHMQTTLDNRIANDQGVFWGSRSPGARSSRTTSTTTTPARTPG